MQFVTIRDGVPDDSGQLSLLAFRSKLHWGYDRDFMEACREELSVPPECFANEIVRVAQEGGSVVGFYRLAEDEIEAFFVDPRRIGAGVGQLLWLDLVDRARGLNLDRLICQSDPQAEGFYTRMGMHRIGELESASIRGRMLPLMQICFR